MALTPDLLAELEILNLFNLNTTQAGIKIHHTASPNAISAAQRLYDKGIISQSDGGYLTDRGVETAEHVQQLVSLLQANR
ncbi:TIGR02647 family protein [Aliikangiella coralliicola]|uniref:TIGR02647 family protein n=1 Tax=Aliikangiella coralliicola TaxID=2592383 RepID=A0A545UF52_9GAMM|nr:TIGR02647 family protein [Aliikangiella coralliicola]TQV88102.1 TIGR02647 family protein [Aliikangiella coralliicola]